MGNIVDEYIEASEKVPYAKKGDIVECPRCRLSLYSLTRDIFLSQTMDEDMFKGIGEISDPKNGQRTDCPSCGKGWALDNTGKMHFKDKGWV